MPLGNPISLTRNVASREVSVSATAEQTLFTVTGGYRINQIDVFRNGVKLNATDDFTALDGSTVTLAAPAAVNDEVVFRILDDFRVADAIVSAASSQVVNGNLRVVGDLFADSLDIGSLGSDQLNITGVTTIAGVTRITDTTESTSNTTGALIVSGGVGIAKSVNIGGSLDVDGNLTIGGTVTYEDVTNVDSIGVITARQQIVLGDFIEHLDDTDTKFGFSAADTFTIHTDGNEVVRITNQGRLGLGTDSPDEMLEIFGADPKIRLTDSSTDKNNNRGEITSNEGDTVYNAVKTGGIGTHIFQSSGTERLRITSAGDVGIGTPNPLDKLHLFNETSSGLRLETPIGIALLSTVQTNDNIANGTIAGDLAIRGKSGISLSPNNGTSVATRITSAGNVGIGLTNPAALLQVSGGGSNGAISITNNTVGNTFTDGLTIQSTTGGDAYISQRENADLIFATSNTDRLRIDNDGRLLVGTTSARTDLSTTPQVQLEGTSFAGTAMSIVRKSSDNGRPSFIFGKSRFVSSSPSVVSSGDGLGTIEWMGHDGTNFHRAAFIGAAVDGTPSGDEMPGRLFFSTSDQTDSVPTERMRIDSSGRLLVGTTSSVDDTYKLQVVGTQSDGERRSMLLRYGQATEDGAQIKFQKNRSNSGGTTSTASGDDLAQFLFQGTDQGGSYRLAASIDCEVDATPANNTVPGRIQFWTTPAGTSQSRQERMRIDSSGNIIAGRTSLGTPGGITPRLQVHGTDNSAFLAITRASNNNEPPYLGFAKTRGGDNTAVADGDSLGAIFFAGGDGTDNHTSAAQIEAQADDTPASNDVKGRIVFKTRSGTSAPSERMRIGSAGQFGIGGANYGTDGQVLTSTGPNSAPAWEAIPDTGGFDAGTVMLFRQTAAPTGWTKDTSNNNGSALRVVTGSVTTGGTDSFGTVFGTSKTTASHTLALSEIPSHTHTIAANISNPTGPFPVYDSGPQNRVQNSGSAGSGGSHSHNLSNMDLLFTDVIQASKD